jgi:hypothetical protein
MFDWFKGKDTGITVNDQVWMSTHAKLSTCLKMLQANPSILFVAWFPETEEKVREFLGSDYSPACLINAAQLKTEELRGRLVIFLEHYPLREKEQLFSSNCQSQTYLCCPHWMNPFLLYSEVNVFMNS